MPGLLSRLFGQGNALENLLNVQGISNAGRQGLLGAGASLLANSATHTGPPTGILAALGQGLQAGQQGYGQAVDQNVQGQQIMMQMQDEQRKREQQAQGQEIMQRVANGEPSNVGDHLSMLARGEREALAAGLMPLAQQFHTMSKDLLETFGTGGTTNILIKGRWRQVSMGDRGGYIDRGPGKDPTAPTSGHWTDGHDSHGAYQINSETGKKDYLAHDPVSPNAGEDRAKFLQRIIPQLTKGSTDILGNITNPPLSIAEATRQANAMFDASEGNVTSDPPKPASRLSQLFPATPPAPAPAAAGGGSEQQAAWDRAAAFLKAAGKPTTVLGPRP